MATAEAEADGAAAESDYRREAEAEAVGAAAELEASLRRLGAG